MYRLMASPTRPSWLAICQRGGVRRFKNLLASDELVAYLAQFPMDLMSLPCMTHFPLYHAGGNFFFLYLHLASDFVLIIEDALRHGQ